MRLLGQLSLTMELEPGRGYPYAAFLAPVTAMPVACPDKSADAGLAVGGPYAPGGALLYNSDIRGPESDRYTDLRSFSGVLHIEPQSVQQWAWDLTTVSTTTWQAGTDF